MAETKIIYHIDEEETPYLVKLPVPPEKVTLADFKNVLSNRPVHSYKFFFKSMDQDFGLQRSLIKKSAPGWLDKPLASAAVPELLVFPSPWQKMSEDRDTAEMKNGQITNPLGWGLLLSGCAKERDMSLNELGIRE
ncbi:hypothetical protein BTVI_122696 [Pitangus sulphuratus]|nr:hypothetical protein BTVI_122696 [Pitangus sulphuratus]